MGFVTLKVYDIMGKEVATLVNSVLKPETYKYKFDAIDHAGGNIFTDYHLEILMNETYDTAEIELFFIQLINLRI